MQKCKHCRYCRTIRHITFDNYVCTNPDIEESAKEYEDRVEKKIVKAVNAIGNEMPKTALLWSPLNRR